jgi:adenylosuccinate lyase
MLVFAERLSRQLELLDQIPFMAKFGGATGGFNAHHVAYPQIDWVEFGNEFIESLNLKRSQYTTQIEHYDCLAAYFDGLSRINTILIDFCRDMWQYISLEYLKQKIKPGEIGSSAMPHKVNPIDFENAEGNLGMANALFSHFSQKLPVSRLQRDLSDSTVLRNIGVPVGHMLVAFQSVLKGLEKIEINEKAFADDLQKHPEVIAEAIQTILRRENFPEPYEALKKLSRVGGSLDMKTIRDFIQTLSVGEEIKAELLQITPENYIGILP